MSGEHDGGELGEQGEWWHGECVNLVSLCEHGVW